MYECFTGHIIFNGQVSEGFQIGTGVRQGCLLSPLLFLIAIDWTMKRSTKHHRTGIQWNLFTQLEDFADDLAVLSETHKNMQKNRNASRKNSQLGLKINVGKTKVNKVLRTHLKDIISVPVAPTNCAKYILNITYNKQCFRNPETIIIFKTMGKWLCKTLQTNMMQC